MRILICSPWIPYPPNSGVTVRTLEIARRFARQHEVTFGLAVRWQGDEANVEALRREGFPTLTFPGSPLASRLQEGARNLLFGLPPINGDRGSRELEKYLEAHASSFDVIQIENEDFGRLPWQIARCRSLVTSIVLHDIFSESYRRMSAIESTRFMRGWRKLNVPGFRRLERTSVPKFDLSIVMSEREQNLLADRVDKEKIIVVPNCADTSSPVLEEPSNPAPVILFIGHMHYAPNIDAAHWLAHDIFPRVRAVYPSARLLLVGGEPPPNVSLKGEGISVEGVVPDLEPYYRQADIAIAPLRAGGGTRLKILEAMAKGRVVVSTSLGTEGLDAVNGRHLLVADTAAGLSDAVIRIFPDSHRRMSLRSQARSLVESRFNWDAAAEKLLDRYLDLHTRKSLTASPGLSRR